jgi:hypothetical protein
MKSGTIELAASDVGIRLHSSGMSQVIKTGPIGTGSLVLPLPAESRIGRIHIGCLPEEYSLYKDVLEWWNDAHTSRRLRSPYPAHGIRAVIDQPASAATARLVPVVGMMALVGLPTQWFATTNRVDRTLPVDTGPHGASHQICYAQLPPREAQSTFDVLVHSQI